MAAQLSTVSVIENIQVAPPPGSVPATTLPLTFFDIPFVSFCPPVQQIIFYELPYPQLDFTQTVLPRLKQSLSLTLRLFFPFAANIVCPQPPHQPSIIYNEGDAIQVTIAEADYDFNYYVANHARDVKQLKSLVQKLPFASLSPNATNVVPIMAMQFTLFPNSGFSIGVTFNHAASDGRSIDHFMKSWASIHRSQGEDLSSLSQPYYNRDIIKDPDGLSATLLKDLRSWEDLCPVAIVPPHDNVLVTLVINRLKIDQLKNWVVTQITSDDEIGQIRISTFVVTCAFIWVNLIKLQEQIRGNLDDDNLLYHFVFGADCRERFEFPIPKTYFGNCLTHYLVSAKRSELMGETGMVVAAKAIGRKVCELDKGASINGIAEWLSDLKETLKHGRLVTVSSSPKFRVYETDFGWGKPKKFEIVHFGAYEIFSLTESREGEGQLNIGVVIGREKLGHFNMVFEHSMNIH